MEPPRAGCEGRVMRVVASRDACGRWMLMVAGGGWMVRPARLGRGDRDGGGQATRWGNVRDFRVVLVLTMYTK